LHTFEHTRLKTVAICDETGEIIIVDVAVISSFGPIVGQTRELYAESPEARKGPRGSVSRSVARCAKPGVTVRMHKDHALSPDYRTVGIGREDRPTSQSR